VWRPLSQARRTRSQGWRALYLRHRHQRFGVDYEYFVVEFDAGGKLTVIRLRAAERAQDSGRQARIDGLTPVQGAATA